MRFVSYARELVDRAPHATTGLCDFTIVVP